MRVFIGKLAEHEHIVFTFNYIKTRKECGSQKRKKKYITVKTNLLLVYNHEKILFFIYYFITFSIVLKVYTNVYNITIYLCIYFQNSNILRNK